MATSEPAVSGRSFTDADLEPLQHAMAGWIAEAGRCGYDHIGELPHRIYENLRGRRPVGDLVHVWERGDEMVAVTICVRFGSAFDVLLAPELRGTAVERDLLVHAAAVTTEFREPGEEYVNTDVHSGDETRMRCLSELGFDRFRIWDDVRERALDRPVPASSVPAGFRLRSAVPGDASELAAARNASFDESWTGEQYRTQVMEKPGYDPDREIVVIAPATADGPGRPVAAFTVYWTDPRNGLGHFEPVGTHGDFRRLGLARAVMLHAMARMREAGLTTASVNHNADNAPARRLYESLGFVRTHQTYGFRRRL